MNLGKRANLALKWFEKSYKGISVSVVSYGIKVSSKWQVFDLDIGDDLNKAVSLVKLLGVPTGDNLSFNEHVLIHVWMPHSRTNVLRMIVNYIPTDCRLNIYTGIYILKFQVLWCCVAFL